MPVKARTQQVNKEMLQTQTLTYSELLISRCFLVIWEFSAAGKDRTSRTEVENAVAVVGNGKSQGKVRNTRFHDGKSDAARRYYEIRSRHQRQGGKEQREMEMPWLVDADERETPAAASRGIWKHDGNELNDIRPHAFSKTTLISERMVAIRGRKGEKEKQCVASRRHRGINNKLLQDHSRSHRRGSCLVAFAQICSCRHCRA